MPRERVAEAARRDECDPRALVLDHGVGRERRPVHHPLDRGRRDARRREEPLDAGEQQCDSHDRLLVIALKMQVASACLIGKAIFGDVLTIQGLGLAGGQGVELIQRRRRLFRFAGKFFGELLGQLGAALLRHGG